MKRLAPEERRYILCQTFLRLQKDWTCRYGQWNTNKLFQEFKRLLRQASQPGGLEALGAAPPAPLPEEEDLPLFDELPV